MSNPWQIQTIQYDKTNSEGNVDTTGYGQISILLSKYVLKEKGKGLSTNDFTDSDAQKLDSIEAGAEVNKLETISINNGNKIYADSDKNINIPIPTKVSDLMNDSGFARLISTSEESDYSDSYVGKSKLSFQDEESINLGKNSDVSEFGGIAIGENTATSETYDINIGNELLHNKLSDIWEGKTSSSLSADVAIQNTNGTNLTELDTVIANLNTEIQNRISADKTLQDNIDSESQTRSDADSELSSNLNTEIQDRILADDVLQNNINSESQTRSDADDILTQKISNIEDLIPNQASSSNQLADKSFVNSTVQTNTANFRGNWENWEQVPTDSDSYPQDYSGSKIPTVNDYLVVQDASDYTLETLTGTWRFKYTGDWTTEAKEGWIPEYQVNEEPFTSEQLYAINSGITDSKVTLYDSHLENTNNPHNVTKSQVGLENVVNTADSATPIEGGTTKFTTGGAYTELNKKVDKVDGKELSTNDFTDTYKNKLDDIDDTVTEGSENIVTSGAVFTAIDTAETNAKNLENASGTLAIANGGTGATTALGAEYNLIGSVSSVETDLTDSRYFALKNETVSASNGTFRWNKVSKIKKYTESNYWYGTCSTASATVAKTVTLSGFELVTNVRVTIKFTNANTATNATLNINSTGAKPIYYHGTNIADNLIVANSTINLVYNGTQYDVVGEFALSTDAVTGVKGEAETDYRQGNVNITKSNLGLTTNEMGITWTSSNITSGYYTSPYYANGIWVIASKSNYGIKYSTDGMTWNDSNITSGTYTSPYYANGIWVIGSGTSSVGIKYSTDGMTWNDSNITSGYYTSPYYANGIWVISSNGASVGIKYSTDGMTWTSSNITSGYYTSPYYANGIWVIGSGNASSSGNAGIKYSTDGITWTSSNITSGTYTSPYYANGIWVIGGGTSVGIKYSTDGMTWNDSNITSGYYTSPYYANGIWVIGSGTSNVGIKYSTDGMTWNDSNITSGYYTSPYYANGIWIIASNINYGIKYSTFNSLNDLGSAFKGITELSEKTTNLIEKTSSAIIYYGICSTSRATNAKVVTCPTFELEIGCKIIIKFTDTAGSAPTSGNISLNINGTGAINLYNKNYTQMTYDYSGEFRANRLCEITYDGTYYIWLNYDSNTTYSTITQAEITAGTSTSSRLVTPKLLADNYNKKSSITSHTLYL